MTHPLTDKICQKIIDSKDYSKYRTEYTHCFVKAYMRAGADWQLEADAEWWRIILNEAEFLPSHAVDYIVEEFKQAMRPQENN